MSRTIRIMVAVSLTGLVGLTGCGGAVPEQDAGAQLAEQSSAPEAPAAVAEESPSNPSSPQPPVANNSAADGDEATPGIAVGEKVPDFQLLDQQGQEQTLDGLLEKGKLAIVFYRSADW